MRRALERIVRKIVPSVPVLARTPLAPILDVVDGVIKKLHPEWSHLPPASLRMRIGVGNRILRNHSQFIKAGETRVKDLVDRGCLSTNSRVLDLGCGCGRNAIPLKKYLDKSGRYIGVDVDQKMIEWCKTNLESENFHFVHADAYNRVYNPMGLPASTIKFPVEPGSISLVIAISLFTHILFQDTLHNIRESARVLQSGGKLYMTAFIIDYIRPSLGGRWEFAHKLDGCYVENIAYPEAAVAYEMNVLEQVFSENNFSLVDIYKTNSYQTIILRKS